MDVHCPSMTLLFKQLGLESDAASIRLFIIDHAPLSGRYRIEEAPFWSATQAKLIRELWVQDAEWAPIVDQLNVALRKQPQAS